MQDGMVSTVMRIYERKDTNEAHIVVGEGSCPGVGCEHAIYSSRLLERHHPGLSDLQNVAVRSGTSPTDLFGERPTGDCAGQSTRATGGGSRRCAAKNRPRSVKLGRSWQMVGQEIFINEPGF